MRAAIISEFMSGMPSKACGNCGAATVSVRREGFVKVFQKPLSKKAKGKMAALGLSYESALGAESRAAGIKVCALGCH